MIDSITSGGQGLQRDTYVPGKSQTIRAYLLECQLRQLLNKKVSPTDYYRLHRELGISLLELEVAIEDRVFILDVHQLQYCIALYEAKGINSLIRFLHEPHLIEPTPEEDKEAASLPQLLEPCPQLEEMGYPVELIEEWCREQNPQSQGHEYR